jgi:hypothetical protein
VTTLDIARRPEPDPEIVALLSAAVAEVWPRPGALDVNRSNAWRFSGRWWAVPPALRRERPRGGR